MPKFEVPEAESGAGPGAMVTVSAGAQRPPGAAGVLMFCWVPVKMNDAADADDVHAKAAAMDMVAAVESFLATLILPGRESEDIGDMRRGEARNIGRRSDGLLMIP